MSTLEQRLRTSIAGDARFDDATRAIYSTDASNYKVAPLGVVLPKTHDDVVATVQLCAEAGVPIVPRGGGSGLAGQAIGPGIVLDFTRYMDALLEIDASSRAVRVQPGMILGQLNKKLAAHGLLFGPDPASAERAAVGGVVGTNATGSHSIRYGMTADNVDALRCVWAPDCGIDQPEAGFAGTALAAIIERIAPAIARDFPRVWRRASGYNIDYLAEMLAFDPVNPERALLPAQARRQGENRATHLRQISRQHLAPLLVGSEGTLGVVTEATLHVHAKPKHTALVIASFQTLTDAMRAIPALLSVDPSAIELIGGLFIKLARDLPECRGRVDWLETAHGIPDGLLVIEFDGDSATEVDAAVARLAQLAQREGMPCTLTPLRDAKLQADVWYVRKIGLNVLASIRSAFKPISVIEDIAVPVDRLVEYVERLNAVFARHGTEGAFYAHASAGVLHVRPLVNLRTRDGLRAMQVIGREAFAICHDLGGAMSGEHGDGYERSQWNRALYGEEIYGAFVEIKRLFDPRGLLNPNKKVDPFDDAQLEHHMRLGPQHVDAPAKTTFAFARDGSMAALAAECNGSGVCRKPDGGVMCPSFRATREEMHSTRGRANLLREFLIHKQLPKTASNGAAVADPAIGIAHVKSALDLCLSCKACASECASGVDMARMKSEFLQQVHDQTGVPLRARLFGHIARLSKLASLAPRIANATLRWPLTKRLLGVAPDRALPAFAPRTFDAWWHGRVMQPWAHNTPRTVALYVDTFSRHNHPDVAIAAVRVLEALGFAVEIPSWHCCGRPLISQGQPRAAQASARAVVAELLPYVRRGVPIIGLEPSCISALTDDYRDLVPSADAEAVAGALRSIEDFLAEQPNLADAFDIPANTNAPLLHGHCHQKALWGTGGVKRLFGRLGIALVEIDSTCCGMAGAFGYEAEHAALSRQIGELALLPAVRAAGASRAVLASGTSCREQIADLTATRAQHPVAWLATHLRILQN
jgi:FAD/FMN-containing dehydrogenase/Fe-S oxidoreductase